MMHHLDPDIERVTTDLDHRSRKSIKSMWNFIEYDHNSAGAVDLTIFVHSVRVGRRSIGSARSVLAARLARY